MIMRREGNEMKCCLNENWEYRSEVTGDVWQKVSLPHTPKIEEFNVGFPFQGLSYYRKTMEYKPEYEGKLISLEFEAVMQIATVLLNGKELAVHKGGYLPFRVNLTEHLNKNGENLLEVIADNRDDRNVPPGKPASLLDFCYWGGIYRNVWLHVEDKLHITDAVEANEVKGGGVFVSYSNVSEDYAAVSVKVQAENLYDTEKICTVAVSMKDQDGAAVCDASYRVVLSTGDSLDAEFKLDVENPNLWSVDSPYLYTLEIFLSEEDGVCDTKKMRIGIRSVSANAKDGLLLNGKPIRITGANRHQTYPHIGNAAHDNAQWRDAYKLKKGGFNFVRLCHYPQSPAFLDACDELGILVMEPTPGWQWCTTGEFCEHVVQNIRDMIRRDRNHPSVIIWETSLNETGDTADTMWEGGWEGNTDEFVRFCRMEAEKEYDKGNFLTAGDSHGRKDAASIGYDIYFTGDPVPGKPTFRREYGDFEFGGNYSLSRRSRGDGEMDMLMQAWNFIYQYNNTYLTDSHSVGSAIWVGIDYNRGYFKDSYMCRCGALDNYRLPKFVYHFFRSQQDIEPVIFIANYWKNPKTKKVVVFSNCDEVALLVNGKEVKRQKPDKGQITPYKLDFATADPFYWAKGQDIEDAQDNVESNQNIKELYDKNDFFDGENCEAISHPPFTFFDVSFEEGTLKATGYMDGKEAVSTSRVTPEAPCGLKLVAEENGKTLTAGGDFLFVYAYITDENGTVVPDSTEKVTFTLKGDGELIESNVRCAEAGIATAMVKSGTESGILKLSATSESGLKDEIDIVVQK